MPLLVLCNPRLDGISWLKEIKEEKIFRESSIKYNFRIQPDKMKKKYVVKEILVLSFIQDIQMY